MHVTHTDAACAIAGAVFVDPDVAEDTLAGGVADVVVIDEERVLHGAGEELTDGDAVVDAVAAAVVGGVLIEAPCLGAVEPEGFVGAEAVVIVQADAVYFALLVTAEVEFDNRVGCDVVGKIDPLPAVADNVQGSAVVFDGDAAGLVLVATVARQAVIGQVERGGHGSAAAVGDDRQRLAVEVNVLGRTATGVGLGDEMAVEVVGIVHRAGGGLLADALTQGVVGIGRRGAGVNIAQAVVRVKTVAVAAVVEGVAVFIVEVGDGAIAAAAVDAVAEAVEAVVGHQSVVGELGAIAEQVIGEALGAE